jgi:hypothetical protein
MTTLARALLKEVPLAHIEVYLQVLDSNVLKNRSAQADDNGTICGGGCDSKGGACGAWCEFSQDYWGCFDIQGQSGVTREDFHAAIADPKAFRKQLVDELQSALKSIEGTRGPALGPKINSELYAVRGGAGKL